MATKGSGRPSPSRAPAPMPSRQPVRPAMPINRGGIPSPRDMGRVDGENKKK